MELHKTYFTWSYNKSFNKANILFVLSFETEENRTSFSEYYTPKVEIKNFNVLIDGKRFFVVPIKDKKQTYEKKLYK